jgi:DNA-binding SARP family transcriptional activator
MANLRTVLWRQSTAMKDGIIECRGDRVQLTSSIPIDLHECRLCAAAVRSGDDVPSRALELLSPDLLPGWYDDWCLLEQERHRQFRLHALEDLARRAICDRSYDRAIQAGLLAVASDPLRMSAHRVVVAAHLAEGNVGEAHRQIDRFRDAMSDAGLTDFADVDLRCLLDVSPTRALLG